MGTEGGSIDGSAGWAQLLGSKPSGSQAGKWFPNLRFLTQEFKRMCPGTGESEKDYQRFRPPPPPPRPPRSLPPPPPPPPRSTFGRASLTFSVRPPSWFPFKAAMAFSPSSAFVISTNPKPRERPVSRSVMMLTRSTCPYASNNCRSSSSDVLKSRFPTKMFFKRLPLDELSECAHFGGGAEAGWPRLSSRSWRTVKCGRSIAGLLILQSDSQPLL
jgi:hypothetical protein